MKLQTIIFAALLPVVSSSMATANEAPDGKKMTTPTSVAPVFAYAKVRSAKERKNNKMGARFEVVVTCPEVNWRIESHEERNGKVAAWKEIKTSTKLHEIVLDFESASQIPESQIIRLDGTTLTYKEIQHEFTQSKQVLLSLDGKGIDEFYKKFFNPNTLIIVLARDEGMGSIELLPKPIKN